MFCKIVLGGTFLLFVTRATFDITSYQAADSEFHLPCLVFACPVLCNISSTIPCSPSNVVQVCCQGAFLLCVVRATISLSVAGFCLSIQFLCSVLSMIQRKNHSVFASKVLQDCFEGPLLVLRNRGNFWILFVAMKHTDSK